VGTPEWSEDAELVGGHVLTEWSVTQREEEDVRAWHAFLPRGPEGDLFFLLQTSSFHGKPLLEEAFAVLIF